MALQLSQYPYLDAETHAVGQIGAVYTWHIDKNVAESVALAMLPALTGPIAQRGLLLLVCDASIGISPLRVFAAATAAQAILRNYYYKIEHANYSHMLFQAMLEGIREANQAVTHHFWPNAEQTARPMASLAMTDNLAGISATAVVAHHNKVVISSVGDTRAYRFRNGKLAPYEQGKQEQLIVLEDDFRKGDRVFVCTQALAAANGTGRIRAAAQASASPAALRALIEAATQTDSTDILTAAVLYRNMGAPLALANSRPMSAPASPTPAQHITRWLTLASVLIVLIVAGWLIFENQRHRLAITLNPTPTAVAIQRPAPTSLMPVPVLASDNDPSTPSVPSVSDTGNLSVVITTSEAGIVVFQLAATETPELANAPTNSTPDPTPNLILTPVASPTTPTAPTVTRTRPVVRVTPIAQPSATPAQPTSPPPPPPEPKSPPRPPQPTAPPPPQPTSPPPQPTSPPPQPTSPPPPPTPDLVLPCLPGDTQCKP